MKSELPHLSRRRLLAVGAALTLAPGAAGARPYRAPRNRFGQPDFEGIWTNASYTDLERPPEFKTLVISEAEAKAAEAIFDRTGDFDPMANDPLGQRESEAWETGSGLARIRGEVRTSWIVDPADGQLPFNAETAKRFGYDLPKRPRRPANNPEERTVTERCVASEAGYPPKLPSPDGNYMRIVQTADHVAMHNEKYNDVQIIRLGDTRHAPPAVTSWMGDAIGRWEGETLVVESTNFCAAGLSRTGHLKLSPAARIVERFTRLSASDLLYAFEVTDPTLYTQTWRAEMPFQASKNAMYEYTCHEGNYGLRNILGGARYEESHPPAAQ